MGVFYYTIRTIFQRKDGLLWTVVTVVVLALYGWSLVKIVTGIVCLWLNFLVESIKQPSLTKLILWGGGFFMLIFRTSRQLAVLIGD